MSNFVCLQVSENTEKALAIASQFNFSEAAHKLTEVVYFNILWLREGRICSCILSHIASTAWCGIYTLIAGLWCMTYDGLKNRGLFESTIAKRNESRHSWVGCRIKRGTFNLKC
jgi:hypothetical protein